MSTVRIFLDTSAQAEEVVLARYRAMPVWRKIEILDDANKTARQLALVGLRSRYPGEPEAMLRRRLLGLVLGEELATKIYGKLEDTANASDPARGSGLRTRP